MYFIVAFYNNRNSAIFDVNQIILIITDHYKTSGRVIKKY